MRNTATKSLEMKGYVDFEPEIRGQGIDTLPLEESVMTVRQVVVRELLSNYILARTTPEDQRIEPFEPIGKLQLVAGYCQFPQLKQDMIVHLASYEPKNDEQIAAMAELLMAIENPWTKKTGPLFPESTELVVESLLDEDYKVGLAGINRHAAIMEKVLTYETLDTKISQRALRDLLRELSGLPKESLGMAYSALLPVIAEAAKRGVLIEDDSVINWPYMTFVLGETHNKRYVVPFLYSIGSTKAKELINNHPTLLYRHRQHADTETIHMEYPILRLVEFGDSFKTYLLLERIVGLQTDFFSLAPKHSRSRMAQYREIQQTSFMDLQHLFIRHLVKAYETGTFATEEWVTYETLYNMLLQHNMLESRHQLSLPYLALAETSLQMIITEDGIGDERLIEYVEKIVGEPGYENYYDTFPAIMFELFGKHNPRLLRQAASDGQPLWMRLLRSPKDRRLFYYQPLLILVHNKVYRGDTEAMMSDLRANDQHEYAERLEQVLAFTPPNNPE